MIALPGTSELLIILIIVIVLFGAGKFSALGTALGRTVREIQNIPRVAREDAPSEEERPEALDVESLQELGSNVRMLLNPRNLLLRFLKWLFFRAR